MVTDLLDTIFSTQLAKIHPIEGMLWRTNEI